MYLAKGPHRCLLAAALLLLGLATQGEAQPLSGTYTIGGSSPNYATFSAAVSDLVSKGVNGAVVFNVRNGTYTEQVNIPAITGSSAANTITFQSESGTASSVTLQFTATASNANYVIGLTGASHIRIQDLTVTSSGVGTSYRNVIRFDGSSTSVSDIIVRGNSFDGYIGTSGSSELSLLNAVYSSNLSNISILNNTFTHGAYGIYLYGNSSSPGSGILVKANTFSNAYGGMYLLYLLTPTIDSNSVSVTNDGVNLNSCGNSSGTTTLLVQRNRVVVSGNAYGMQINNCSGPNASYPGLVVNNFVTATGNSSYGLTVGNSSYLNVYYNSINVTGGGNSIGLYLSSGTGDNVMNNIFMNAGGGYACYVSSASAAASSDYNDFYSLGGPWLAYWGSNGYAADLAELQGVSGMDAHSVSANPLYTSATDLHVNSPWLDGAGGTGTGVTADIFGVARNSSTPDIGGVEFTSSLTKLAGGSYTIGGSSPNYPTFGAAVTDLNTRGITGAVTFSARTGSYNEQVTLNPVAGASGTNTVTFQSESGVASDAVLHYSQSQSDATLNHVFLLNSAAHVRIKNLMLVSDGVGTSYRNVLVLDGNVSDLVVQGDSLRGYVGSNNGNEALSLLYGTSVQTGGVTIMNNHFGGGSFAVHLNAANSGGAQGTVLKGNIVSNAQGYGGLYLYNHAGALVDSNIVSAIGDGIELNSCGNTGGTTQLLVQRNRVVVSGNGYGMQVNSCSAPNASYPGFVVNNFVTAAGNSAYGMQVANSAYMNVCYNSIDVAGAGNSIALYMSSGTGDSVVNNIFMNPGGGYAYYVSNGGVLAFSDYNSMFSTGTNLAYWNGNQANLAAFQSASGTDAHSNFYQVTFVSLIDLHLAGASLGNNALRGVPFGGITTDIDGNLRSATSPYRGASEGATPLSVDNNGKVASNGIEIAPRVYQLLQNYPNPFNPTTELKFSVGSAGRTTIELFNVLGERVMTLFDDVAQPGQYYRVTVNGNTLASGAYFYVIRSGSYTNAMKMLLLK